MENAALGGVEQARGRDTTGEGPNIDAKDGSGWTALHLTGNGTVVARLLL